MKKTQLVILILLAISVFWNTETPQLSNVSVADHMDLSSTIYQYERYIEEERYDEASSLLSKHKQEIIGMVNSKSPDYIKDDLLTIINNTSEQLNHHNPDKKLVRKNTFKLVLAIDAITSPTDPIWHIWKTNLNETISNVTQMNAEVEIEAVLANWEIIEPAVAVTVEEEKYKQLHQSFQRLKNNSDRIQAKEQLEGISEQLQAIETENKDNNVTLVWMVSVVGGFIVLTLSYVGWKKYKGEKNEVQTQKTN